MTIHPLSRAPGWRWLLAAFFAVLVAHDLHELIHTGAGRLICGAWGPRDFNVWSLASGCESWLPTLMGPVFSWAVMWTGVALLGSALESRRWIGLALVFAPNPLGRLLPALQGGGDEGVVARYALGREGPWARLVLVVAAACLIVPPLLAAWRALPPRRRWAWFLLLFIGGILVTGPLYIVLGNGLLARGVLAAPGMFGAPQLVEAASVLSLTGFVLTCRWLPNRET